MIAKEAYQTNKPVREIILSKNLLTEEELDIILSPSEMTRPGIAGDKLLKRKSSQKSLIQTLSLKKLPLVIKFTRGLFYFVFIFAINAGNSLISLII